MKLARLAIAALLLVAGCAGTTPRDVLPAFNPADPIMGIRDTHYHPVVTDYSHREPAEPRDWKRLNEELSPAKPGAGS